MARGCKVLRRFTREVHNGVIQMSARMHGILHSFTIIHKIGMVLALSRVKVSQSLC